MHNGVLEIEPINEQFHLTNDDIFRGLMKMVGASVSSMPNIVCEAYNNRWEVFDPEYVRDAASLPTPWAEIFALHNEPNRKACRDLAYRYLHSPVDILPQYPRLPCKGVFCIIDPVDPRHIGMDNLVWIGDELQE